MKNPAMATIMNAVEYSVNRRQILPQDLAVSVAVSVAVALLLIPKRLRRRRTELKVVLVRG
jgi:hypothetical protein